MRVLVLDDAHIRHRGFRCEFQGHYITNTFTAPEAIEALKTQERFDLATLDHDLKEEHYLVATEGVSEDWQPGMPEYSPGTGMDVVDFICTMPPEKRPLQVIVHSWNISRSPEMVQRLRDAGMLTASWRKYRARM